MHDETGPKDMGLNTTSNLPKPTFLPSDQKRVISESRIHLQNIT